MKTISSGSPGREDGIVDPVVEVITRGQITTIAGGIILPMENIGIRTARVTNDFNAGIGDRVAGASTGEDIIIYRAGDPQPFQRHRRHRLGRVEGHGAAWQNGHGDHAAAETSRPVGYKEIELEGSGAGPKLQIGQNLIF